MDKTFPQIRDILRLFFWRIAAETTGFAVRHRQQVRQVIWVAPLMLAGAMAYLLGRWVGMLLLWSLTL